MPQTLKALCVKDYGTPNTNYATLIEQGIKTIETRKWATQYRGDLLITCAKSSKSPHAGLALCVVTLTHIEPMTPAHEPAACCAVYPQAKAWHITNLRPLSRKFPVKSFLSLFNVQIPYDVVIGIV